jgi:predicted ribosome quality control (RQC) complex YloA/Tae2 family protein
VGSLAREFTSFDVAAVVYELKASVSNTYVRGIYQVDDKTLLLKLRRGELDLRLVLEAGRRLHLTSYVFEKPMVPPAFCMALRKHLRNSLLMDVEQYEFERVVIFHFKSKNGFFRLVLELFGDGNIILIDGENRILQALYYKRMRDRNILRGESFTYAPASGQNPFKIDGKTLLEGLKGFGKTEVVRALARFLGLGGVYAEEVLIRLNIEKTTPCDILEAEKVNAIYECVKKLISQVFEGRLEPSVIIDEAGEFIDVTPLRLTRYNMLKYESYSSFNEALDEFYIRKTAVEKALAPEKAERLRLKQEVNRLERVLAEQEKALKEEGEKAERFKLIGDLIYMHLTELQALTDFFMKGRTEGKEWDEIVRIILTGKRGGVKPYVIFESFDRHRLVVNVCVEGIRFEVELQKDMHFNAAKYYEKAKIARRKLEGARKAFEETWDRLEKAKAELLKVESLELVKPAEALKGLSKRKVERKKWFEKFRWFNSSDGFLVVAGKDAVSNEVLIKKYTDTHDLVFHADIVGAPFVVVKTGGMKPSERCLSEAAEFAAALSRAWREGFASVDVYWVRPDQLRKGGPSGEYVPKGAFIVAGQRNWMRGTPLRLAVGVSTGEDGGINLLGGPLEAVKSRSKAYVTLVPGNNEGKELFIKILRCLAEKLPREMQDQLSKVSSEAVRELVPYGKARVLFEN